MTKWVIAPVAVNEETTDNDLTHLTSLVSIARGKFLGGWGGEMELSLGKSQAERDFIAYAKQGN